MCKAQSKLGEELSWNPLTGNNFTSTLEEQTLPSCYHKGKAVTLLGVLFGNPVLITATH